MVEGYVRWRHRGHYYCAGVPGHGRGRCARGSSRFCRTYPPNTETLAEGWGTSDDGLPELSREDEIRMLEEEEQMLRHQLDEVLRALEALKNDVEKEVS